MAMTKEDIISWLQEWPEGTEFGIDEGGLALRPIQFLDYWLEIGGIPIELEEGIDYAEELD